MKKDVKWIHNGKPALYSNFFLHTSCAWLKRNQSKYILIIIYKVTNSLAFLFAFVTEEALSVKSSQIIEKKTLIDVKRATPEILKVSIDLALVLFRFLLNFCRSV